MKHRPIALSLSLSLALLLATAFASSAPAQRRGSAAAGRPGTLVVRNGVIRAGSPRMRGTGGYYGGLGYSPYFYSDSGLDYDSNPVPPPQSLVEPPAARVPPAKPSEALVLELQGDHWVRITPYGPPQTVSLASAAQPPQAAHIQTPAATPIAPPPRAVLVFRDGHQEEIGQYRIMGATIYLNTDYWTSGAWTRTVPIADLDVPATLKLNQQRGANFRLPSGPNEVMIGG